uniref:C2H2-type domain-containing protein n=1 Tax=Neogobius melanostomus TaxID=47308 RepID=A0A8C6THH8_9GOBI
NRQEPIEERCEGEEPRRSSVDSHLDNNKQHGGSSDTDNSSDWESADKRATKNTRHKLKAGRSKKSATDHATGYERPHRCAECSRTFKSEKNLNKHLQLHAGQGAITCHVCSKVFSHKSMYRKHLRLHTGQRPYSCSVCERRFNSRGHLKEHARSHTGEKPYSCSGCGMEFRLRTTRDRHFKKIHNVQKLYTCSVCEKSYVEKYYYVIHMRIHTGERPFSCSVCNKGYREKKMLKKHMSGNNRTKREL